MFLSIVIPVYNGSQTIKRCLDSIWAQNLPDDDFEVICVDDRSSDNTIEILRGIQSEHKQLIILKNATNIRAGGSRNYGVNKARGEYIQFIDADDYFHPNSLLEAYTYQKIHQLDILMCDFARHKDGVPNNKIVHKFPSTDIMTGRRFLVVNSLPYAPWKYMFKRGLMMDNQIFFAEKVSCEDVDWSHKIALFANTMQYLPILLIHYVLLESSQTGSEYKRPETVFYRLMSGKRVADLIPLGFSSEEQIRLRTVAQETLFYGVIFLCALTINPIRKANVIKECIDPQIAWRKELAFVRNNPLMYGILSTVISPIFKLGLYIKRNFFGR